MANKNPNEGREPIAAIQLHKPIRSFGEDLMVLSFYREPTLDDFERADALGKMGTLKVLIAACCGITVKEAGALSAKDFKEASVVIKGFLGQAADDEEDEDEGATQAH